MASLMTNKLVIVTAQDDHTLVFWVFFALHGGVKDTLFQYWVSPGWNNRGTQRVYSSKPLKQTIFKRILVFKR